MNAIDILPYLQSGPLWLFSIIGPALVGTVCMLWLIWRLPWNPLRKRTPVLTVKQKWILSALAAVLSIVLLQGLFQTTSAKMVKAREVADVYNAIDLPGSKLRFVQNDWYSALVVLGVYGADGTVVAKVELHRQEMSDIYAAIVAKHLRFRDQAREDILMSYHHQP